MSLRIVIHETQARQFSEWLKMKGFHTRVSVMTDSRKKTVTFLRKV